MSQSGSISPQSPVKPLILTIIPQQKSVSQNNSSNLPTFNHIPVVPNISENSSNPEQIWEREKKRLEIQRQSSQRHYEKVKQYNKLAAIDGEKEKIMALLLICYPDLKTCNKLQLDQRLSSFLDSVIKEFIG